MARRLKRTVVQAIEAGHLRPDYRCRSGGLRDRWLFIALMRDSRFLRDPRAPARALVAYERLIESLQPNAPRPRIASRSK
jgi:hypothetical protein